MLSVVSSSPRWARSVIGIGVLAGLSIYPRTCVASSAAGDALLDTNAIAQLEQHVEAAAPRERPILLTELADRLTVLAAAQLKSGDFDQASVTLDKVEACAQKIDASLDSKSKDIKKAEMRIHETQRRLTDLIRAVGSDVKPRLQATLSRINQTQRSFLAILFSH